MRAHLLRAKTDIVAFFEGRPHLVYSENELESLVRDKRAGWRLTKATKVSEVIDFLREESELCVYSFEAEAYGKHILRYSWRAASPHALAMSLRPRGYLCHGTAAMLHGLIKGDPKTILLNNEQTPKPPPRGGLSQEAINRAFASRQRLSNLRYKNGDVSVVILSGKHSGRLRVQPMNGPVGEVLHVTDLARTLVDIVVRPSYCGAAVDLVNAYQAARGRVSVADLIDTLEKLAHVYPYHQTIGFLMEAAGFPEEECLRLRELGLKHDFYLTHGMDNPEYSAEWRLYYPPGLLKSVTAQASRGRITKKRGTRK